MSNNQVAVKKEEGTLAQRFTNKVMQLFSQHTGQEIALTNFQKRLAQNYCISLDGVLKKAEQNRLKKSEKHRDKTSVTWNNVDMEELANDVVAVARVGFDPAQPNHINMIPFKDNSSGKYKIGFIEGYRGIELKAKKYGLDIPDAVIVDLVYTNDKFKVIKKDKNNQAETYEFQIVDPFDRGEVKGGFYYHIFNDNPSKNKLVTFNKDDIEKRKPVHASVEFWGGEKDVWKDGKKTGKKEKVEGWYEKMCYKTVYRAAYNDITIDSQKIDDDYLRLKKVEDSFVEAEVKSEIEEKANKDFIDIEPEDIQDVVETQEEANQESEQISIEETPEATDPY